jgi:hypothetical protein
VQNTVGFIIFCLLWMMAPWYAWYLSLVPVTRLASSHRDRRVLYLSPVVSLLLLGVALLVLVPANRPGWLPRVGICWAVGGLWIGLASHLLPWWGLSARQDVAERRIGGAGWAIAAAQAGLALAFAFAAASGDVADAAGGLLRGALGTMALLGLWAILERWASLSEAITVGRDGGTACRLAAFLVALGPLVGRAFMALPEPADEERVQVLVGAPVALLLLALPVEWSCTRRADSPGGPPRRRDVAVALSYLAASVLLLYLTR